jgi:hypothetical protein
MSENVKPDAASVKTPYRGALAAIKRRWRVAPLPRRAKAAPPKGFPQIPLATPEQVAKWEAELPGRNYAIIPGIGLTFIDVDVRDEKGGLQSLDTLELEYGKLPKTFTVRTPSGGLHYYFRGLHTFKNGFRPGLDCPPYVVAPFSVTDTGRYEVIDPSPAAPMPNWLPEVVGLATEHDDADQDPAIELDHPNNIKRAIYHLTHDARRSVQGRNGEFALLLTAGELKDMGISKPQAIQLLDTFYNVEPFCDPVWNVGDGPIADRLDVKVENAWRYLNQSQPGSASPEVDFSDEALPTDAELAALAAEWKERDRKSRLRRSVTFINGVAYPVVKRGRANT